jgi:hypothetical protein
MSSPGRQLALLEKQPGAAHDAPFGIDRPVDAIRRKHMRCKRIGILLPDGQGDCGPGVLKRRGGVVELDHGCMLPGVKVGEGAATGTTVKSPVQPHALQAAHLFIPTSR